MFERFTDRARRVLVLASNEAKALGLPYIDSDMLLLGIAAEQEGAGAVALARLAYFCGCCWKTIKQIDDQAQHLLDTGGA